MGAATGISENGRTVRQRVVEALFTKLQNMQDEGQPVWLGVYKGDLEDLGNTQCPAAGMDFGTEEYSNKTFPVAEYALPVFFHFRFREMRGLDEHDVYEYYLGLLQFALLGDHNLDGLALNVEEDSNAHSIIGIDGVYPGGTLSAIVTYRTRLHNPYKLKHEN